jgi:GT2 family glycosyltransferase
MMAPSDTHGQARREAQPAIAQNAWDTIAIPELGHWKPGLAVSVIIPHFEAPKELERTLAGLARQTYPMELVEVVIADDGSRPVLAPAPGDSRDLRIKVVHQERRGFGAPRARNLGAGHASGDIVLFLDGDMVPERQLIEAHARWHHTIDYAVVFGLRYHVAFANASPEQIAEAVGADEIDALVEEGDIRTVDWIDWHLERTDWLRAPATDLWRLTSSGNLSMYRDFFHAAGGFDESFTQWGGEDNELGYRLYNQGAVVVPDRAATAWHQGAGHEPTAAELKSLHDQRPKLVNLIPDPTIRPRRTGRSYRIPTATVHVRAWYGTSEQTLSVVESILAGRFSDVVVYVDLGTESEDLAWLKRHFESDPRVHVGVDLDPISDSPSSAIRVELPNSLLLSIGTLEAIFDRLQTEHLGAIHMTHPDLNSREMVEVYTTRAWQRARRLKRDGSDHSELIGRLFGERWVAGTSHGCFPAGPAETIRAQRSWLSELESRDHHIRQLTARRSLRVADAFGTLARSRSWQDLRNASRTTLRALTRE